MLVFSQVRANSLFFTLLQLTGVVLFGIHISSQVPYPPSIGSCVSDAVLSRLAFVFCFGALFAKTWRIFRIFGQKKSALLALASQFAELLWSQVH